MAARRRKQKQVSGYGAEPYSSLYDRPRIKTDEKIGEDDRPVTAEEIIEEHGGRAREYEFETEFRDRQDALDYAEAITEGKINAYIGTWWYEIFVVENADGTFNVVVEYVAGVKTT